jgi:plastocyanin
MPSPEPHTITLNPPPGAFVFGLLAPFGGQTLSGAGTTLNSGQLNLGGTFSLNIADNVVPGTYRFVCVLHLGMTGTVSVLPSDQALPKTDAQYQAQAFAQETVDLAQARQIGVQARVAAAHASDLGGTGIEVAAGGGEQSSAALRFFPSFSTIHVGDSVTFVNRDQFATHSVTFGEPTPYIFFPYGDPTIRDPNQQVNSGVLASASLLSYFNAPNPPLAPNMRFTATFAAPGTYQYVCVFHDDMGMVGSLTVLP